MSKPWFAPSRPGEIAAYPWLHPDAVEYLEGLLQTNWRVLEHGAGGSTLWLTQRVAEVVSVEHDHGWAEAVVGMIPTANITVLFDLPPVHAFDPFDLFFIDGERKERSLCLKGAHLYVKTGGWVVLDNANRPEYREERYQFRQRASLKARFDNNIPQSKFFVTEFWQLCE